MSLSTAPRARTEDRDTTEDRVFLLSVDDVEQLLRHADWSAELSEQAVEDLDTDPDDRGWGWWVRLPRFTGFDDDKAVSEMEEGGHWGFWSAAVPAPGVRPAAVLKPGSSFTGSGMAKNPYRPKT